MFNGDITWYLEVIGIYSGVFENGIFRGPALIGDHGLIASGFSFNCLEPLRSGWDLETKTYEKRIRLHLGRDRPKMLKTYCKDIEQMYL